MLRESYTYADNLKLCVEKKLRFYGTNSSFFVER